MCLIFFSYHQHPQYRLIFAANRDEFYDRPTSPLDFWEDDPDILAGRDLKEGGTWMGITPTGRFAAITNFRDPASIKANAPSRGLLIRNFLSGKDSPTNYLKQIQNIGQQFNGFNLLIGDTSKLLYYSNQANGIQEIKPGLYGLSNHLLNTPWPKVEKGKAKLKMLFNQENMDIEAIFQVLKDREHPPDNTLPDTGVGLTWERILSPIFVSSEIYGTRSSSILLMEYTGQMTFIERTFFRDGVEGETRRFFRSPTGQWERIRSAKIKQ